MTHTERNDIVERAAREGRLEPAAAATLRKWLSEPAYASQVGAIEALLAKGEFEELQNAFGSVIPFGTGGRRGAMGPGPNRINERTIAESAQGLSRHVLASGGGTDAATGKPGRVVIAYDTRHHSREFAEVAASVVAANGLEAVLFEGPRSTPELSFAVRHLGARAGIVISASHNPPQDNGFKAYWSDGGQVVPPHDTAIIDEVVRAAVFDRADLGAAAAKGLFRSVGEEIDRAYVAYAAGLALGSAREIKIVYTPLHGTGASSVAPALASAGFVDVRKVPSQWEPDPDFSGVPGRSPNPENPSALEAAVAIAKSEQADLVLASDPDADRLGAVVRHDGNWVFLSGNRIGVLLFEHLARTLAGPGKLPAQSVVFKTCVTTDLLDRIAESYGIRTVGDFLVGFKYIAEAIQNLPDPAAFLFGTEESHGYLRGPAVRDKDAAQAAVLLAERAAELKREGKSLVDGLEAIWGKYGYYSELTRSIPLQGTGGGALGLKMMEALRAQPPKSIAGETIVALHDRKSGAVIDPATGRTLGKATGAAGNVLVFHLKEAGSERISVRPSGTEPKIKVYVQIKSEAAGADGASADARAALDARAERLAAAFADLTRRA